MVLILHNGWAMDVEKTTVIRLSKEPSTFDFTVAQKNWRMWNISTSWIAWYQIMQDVHVKLNPGLSRQKQYSIGRKLFTNKFDLNARKKLVKCCIWSVACYDADTWTLRKVDQNYLGRFGMWFWRRVAPLDEKPQNYATYAENHTVNVTALRFRLW